MVLSMRNVLGGGCRRMLTVFERVNDEGVNEEDEERRKKEGSRVDRVYDVREQFVTWKYRLARRSCHTLTRPNVFWSWLEV